jgi:hypothetical protein
MPTLDARCPLPLALLLLALLPAGGCSSFRPPSVQLVDAAVLEIGTDALQVGIELELANVNDEPMRLIELEYRLSVEGRGVFEGRRAAQATIARDGRRRIVLPAVVRFDDVEWNGSVPPEIPYALTGTVLYIAPGELAEILLDTGLRRPRSTFTVRGMTRGTSG